MKHVLLVAAVLFGSLISAGSHYVKAGFDYAAEPETIQHQTHRLQPELWKIQKQFGLQHEWMTVSVKSVAEMVFIDENGVKSPCGCWGMTDTDHLNMITLLSIEDYPESMPWNKRVEFQNTVLQHEVMHIVFTGVGVPGNFQDLLIHRLQPSLPLP